MGAAKSSEELKALKEQAKALGISFSPNIGLSALQEKIKEHLNTEGITAETVEPVKEEVTEVQKTLSGIKGATRLHRVIVRSLHPDKQDLKYETIQVGNTKYGFFGRTIPLGSPWHVEDILYIYLKNKKFYNTITRENKVGGVKKIEVINKEANEYIVEDLPPLTPEELRKLAIDQRSTNRLADDVE